MTRVTTTLEDDQAEYLQQVKEEDLDSDAAALRVCIDQAAMHENAQQRATELQTRVEELRNELQAANRRINSATAIVDYVEEERSIEERRQKTGLSTRAKWWLFGMEDSEA